MKHLFYCLFILISLDTMTLYAKTIQVNFFNQDEASHLFLYHTKMYKKGFAIEAINNFYSHFNNSIFIDFEKKDQNYKNISLVEDNILGSNCGVFYSAESQYNIPIVSSFEDGFAIEFWIKPFSTGFGDIISTRHLLPEEEDKALKVEFEGGRTQVAFYNIFKNQHNVKKTIKLKSTEAALIDQWAHHQIIFESQKHAISYFINNRLVARRYTTEDETAHGVPLESQFYTKFELIVGGGYHGLLDNIFVTSDPINYKKFLSRKSHLSFILSKVYAREIPHTLQSLKTQSFIPQDSDILIEYRMSSSPFYSTASTTHLPFKPYHPDKIKNQKYRFIQFKFILLPDTQTSESPIMKGFSFQDLPIQLPYIPQGITGENTKEGILIHWNKEIQPLDAYRIYYGSKKDEYKGTDSINGMSPIEIKIKDLDYNLKTQTYSFILRGIPIYQRSYIRITAIDQEQLESPFSEEISVQRSKVE